MVTPGRPRHEHDASPFDPDVQRAMARWPDVPECYGWLGLDMRGRWLLQGEPLKYRNLSEFIARNYWHDEHGRWFFQNGPQRVYLELEYTPWVYRIEPPQRIVTHTGRTVERLDGAYIDEQGRCLLETELGIGLLEGRDLPLLAAQLEAAGGEPLDDEALAACIERLAAGDHVRLQLRWHEGTVPVHPVRAAQVPERFGYVPRPTADDGA